MKNKNKIKNPEKIIDSESIMESYIEYILENNAPPKSIYSFAKYINLDEGDFYHYYSSFNAIEESFFLKLFSHTLEVLEDSSEYELYNIKEKLLSFYYTFYENLKANRSFVILILQNEKNPLEKLRKLKKLKTCFISYIATLGLNENLLLEQKNLQDIQLKAQQESAWLQFISIFRFWLKDDSRDFEKTDILIEKSIDIGIDFIENSKLNKWIDFGKFLFKERKNIL